MDIYPSMHFTRIVASFRDVSGEARGWFDNAHLIDIPRELRASRSRLNSECNSSCRFGQTVMIAADEWTHIRHVVRNIYFDALRDASNRVPIVMNKHIRKGGGGESFSRLYPSRNLIQRNYIGFNLRMRDLSTDLRAFVSLSLGTLFFLFMCASKIFFNDDLARLCSRQNYSTCR